MDIAKTDVGGDGRDYVGPLIDEDTRSLTCLVARYSATGSTALVLPPGVEVPLGMDHANTCHLSVVSSMPWQQKVPHDGYITVHTMWKAAMPAGFATTIHTGIYVNGVLEVDSLHELSAVAGDRRTLSGSMLVRVTGVLDTVEFRIGHAGAGTITFPSGTWSAYIHVNWAAHAWCGGCLP